MRAISAVVLLVLLAGCNGAPSVDGPDTATSVTPVEVPADYDYAPGVTTDGVTEPATLAAAHEQVLANSSFRITANRTVRYANGTLREQLLVDVAVAENRTFLAAATTRGPNAPVFLGRPPATGTYWSNGSVNVRKLTRDGTTTYNEFEMPGSGAGTWRYWTQTVPFGGGQATPGAYYGSLFAAVPTSVTGENTSGSTTSYRLASERPIVGEFRTDVTDVRDVRLVATVREDGLVTDLSLRYVGEVDGATVRVVRTVRYRGVGSTTVARPSWFENATGG